MPIIPPPSPTALTYTVQDIIADAMIECGMLAPGETPDGESGQWAFRKLNYLLDVWAAERKYVVTTVFQTFTLVPGLSPHLIGSSPAATFSVAQRPVRIESCSLLINSGNQQIDLPMNIRDDDWWAAQQVKNIQTNIPTDLYYSQDWPDGSIYFWPVPNTANDVRMQLWTLLQQYDSITDNLGGPGSVVGTMPPAYRTAIMLTLAETLLPGAKLEAHALLIESARRARAAIFGNNAKSPRINTQDLGMPKAGRARPDFNWMSGGYPGGPPE
jgi:hypothetical protein